MLERDLQKKCVTLARRRGWWASKFVAQGRRSAPDYIFANSGHVVFIEFKCHGALPTELQLEFHKEMRAHGLYVYVIDNFEDFVRRLDVYYEE